MQNLCIFEDRVKQLIELVKYSIWNFYSMELLLIMFLLLVIRLSQSLKSIALRSATYSLGLIYWDQACCHLQSGLERLRQMSCQILICKNLSFHCSAPSTTKLTALRKETKIFIWTLFDHFRQTDF